MKTSLILLLPPVVALALTACKPPKSEENQSAEPPQAAAAQPTAPAKPAEPAAPAPVPQPQPADRPVPAELKPGMPVDLQALAAAKWIQGGAPTEFEPGKVYLFECWATWCGPCIAAIPHVNDLHRRYFEKGLRVFGINVWEDGEEKVANFVKDKGDGMAYPVAYTGKDSEFERRWLKPAGVSGIPHAFIVRDGKLVLASHPSRLTDSVIESLLAGDEGAEKAVKEINEEKEARAKVGSIITGFRQAGIANDAETMAAKIAELEQADANNPYLPSMKLDLLVARKDWQAAVQAITDMPDGPGRQISLTMTASRIAARPDGEYPPEFISAVTGVYAERVAKTGAAGNPMESVTLSILQWKAGEKDKALATAKDAAARAATVKTHRTLTAEPFERFAKSLETGTAPTMQEFSSWVREAMKSKEPAPQPAPLVPATPAPAEP